MVNAEKIGIWSSLALAALMSVGVYERACSFSAGKENRIISNFEPLEIESRDLGSVVMDSQEEDLGSNETIDDLIRKYGLNKEEVRAYVAVAMVESGSGGYEAGSVMRVAYNRLNDQYRRFKGRTIQDIVRHCQWNCSAEYRKLIDRALKTAFEQRNEKYVQVAIDFLLGKGDAAEGAKAVGCRSGFYSVRVKTPAWANDRIRLGGHYFAHPLNGCNLDLYPPRQQYVRR